MADGDTITIQLVISIVGYGYAEDVIQLVQTPQVDAMLANGWAVLYTGPIPPGVPDVTLHTVPQALTFAQQQQVAANLAAGLVPQPLGAPPGYVLTVDASGNSASPQPLTGLAAAIATAVAAYLATNPTPGVTLNPGYMTLPGVNGSYAQCPDAVGLQVAGDIDVRWYGALGSLTGSGFQSLVMRQNSASTSWMLRETAAGKLQWAVSHDGTTVVTATCSVASPSTGAYRATWRQSDGRVQFFKLDPAGTVVLADGSKWTQLGTDQTASTSNTTIYTGGALPITVGAAGNGTSVVSAGTVVTKVEIRSGLDGTVVGNPTFSNHTFTDRSFTDGHSNTFTLAGTAAIVAVSGTQLSNGTTLTFATPGSVQTAAGGPGWSRPNPVLNTYKPGDYGDLVTSDDTRRLAVQAAIDAAYAAGGGVVDLNGPQLTTSANPALLNQITGLPYASILAKDNVRLYAEDPHYSGLKLGNGANCHLIAHPGRLNNQLPNHEQDNIKGFTLRGLLLDGNAANQDGCHDHDGLRFPQFPGLVVDDVVIQNCDGHGYYSTANGDFAQLISDLGQNVNATVVKPLWLNRMWVLGCARWGYMMSATNRKTSEKNLYAIGNGTAQARIVGKKVTPTISAGGTLALTIDSSATVVSITLGAGASGTTILSAINSALSGTATASYSTTGRLMITSATTGGTSWVGVDNSSSTSVLLDLGLARISDNGPLPGTPMHLNAENNAAVGGNEYGGFYADHSEADTDAWHAEQNIGDGLYVHNVSDCAFGTVNSVANNGMGIVVNELNTSGASIWRSAMNCADLGYASYRPRTIRNAANVAITTPSTESLFLAGTVGYGVTQYSVIQALIGPGLMATLGSLPDNRHANAAVVIEHGVSSSFVINNLIYGDGGLNLDGLGANLRDYR